MIMSLIRKLLPERKAKSEIKHLRHQLNNDIQAVRSGVRVMQSMSGTIDLVQKGRPR